MDLAVTNGRQRHECHVKRVENGPAFDKNETLRADKEGDGQAQGNEEKASEKLRHYRDAGGLSERATGGTSVRLLPSSVRRGGCGINKKSAKPTLTPQTGWSLTSQIPCERPPRPLVQTWLRAIF